MSSSIVRDIGVRNESELVLRFWSIMCGWASRGGGKYVSKGARRTDTEEGHSSPSRVGSPVS